MRNNRLRDRLLQVGIGALVFAPVRLLAAPPSADTAQCQALHNVTNTATECSSSSAPTLASKIGNVIDALFLVAGAVAVIIMILGGIRYITSTGDSTRIQRAKDSILYAVIGLIVVILAREIVAFVIGKVA